MPQVLYPFNKAAVRTAGRIMGAITMRSSQARVPQLGLSLRGLPADAAAASVAAGLEIGYRHFDVYPSEGHGKEVGAVLRSWLDANGGGSARHGLFVSAKMPFRTSETPASEIQEEVKSALSELRCGYLDVLSPEWILDVSQEEPDIRRKELKHLWDAYRELLPPNALVTRGLGLCNVPTSYFVDAILRDLYRQQPDLLSHEVSLYMQARDLRYASRTHDVIFSSNIVVPDKGEKTPRLLKEACASKKISPLALTCQLTMSEGDLAMPVITDPALMAEVFHACTVPLEGEEQTAAVGNLLTSYRKDVLLLRTVERNVLHGLDKGESERTIGVQYPNLWKARDIIETLA